MGNYTLGGLIKYGVKKAIDYVFYRPTVWIPILKIGLGLVVFAGGGLALKVSFSSDSQDLSFAWNSGNDTLEFIAIISFWLGVIFLLIGLGGVIYHAVGEARKERRRKVLVVEQRGLAGTADASLESAIPSSIKGERVSILNDLRPHLLDPQSALDKVQALPHTIVQSYSGKDRDDITMVYGGIAQVPLTFLTGFILDDESPIELFDWDRDAEQWRELDGEDDGYRFEVSGLEDIQEHTPEVLLAVSVSYKVDMPSVRLSKGDLPLVHLELPHGSTSCHWSKEKQQELAKEFRETLVALKGLCVGHVHLFLIAPNSLVFRFGRTCDQRNFPPMTVYQYEYSKTPPHPWGVKLPTHGERASIWQA